MIPRVSCWQFCMLRTSGSPTGNPKRSLFTERLRRHIRECDTSMNRCMARMSGEGWRACRRQCTTTSKRFVIPRKNSAICLIKWDGAAWSAFIPANRCTGSTATSLQTAKEAGASILLHPAVGMTKPGDLHYYARVHCYQAIRRHYPHDLTVLSLLPIAVRMAGPREALHNAIVRQNYGCSHFIVGPEHCAPPDVRAGGTRFYPTYAAQELVARDQDDLAIRIIPVKERRYVPENDQFQPADEIERNGKIGVLFTEKELYHC